MAARWPLSKIMVNIQKNIALASYTAFKIGGPAKYFSEAKSVDEIQELCLWAKKEKIPVVALGGGSNVLISDNGFDGLVIKIETKKLEISGELIYCDAGVPLAKLTTEAIKKDLTGLEWAIGIPGTAGGAINGNAGAFSKSISNNVEEVRVLDLNHLSFQGKIFKKNDCKFSYRSSVFKKNPNLIILSAVLRLQKGNKEEMQQLMKGFIKQRMESNPIIPATCGSAGCFFKNPEWPNEEDKKKLIEKFPALQKISDKPKISAGFLIESIGLKGKKAENAMISEKHANFIINGGNASADDIICLTDLIKEKIKKQYGLNLENEVRLIGF